MAAKGIGPLLLLGGGAALLLAGRKKKAETPGGALGIEVGDDCSDITVIDPESFDVHMWDVYTHMRAQGVDDQFEIADAIVDTVSPQCRKFPEDLHSPEELDLYSRAVQFATIHLANEKDLRVADVLTHPRAAEFGKWLDRQRKRLIFDAPSDDQILIVEDGDQIMIGKRWVSDVFMPTMHEMEDSLIFGEGTAVTLAAIVLQNTRFANPEGDPIEVDLKASEIGQEMLFATEEAVKGYIRAQKEKPDEMPTVEAVGDNITLTCPVNAKLSTILRPGCMIAMQFGNFEV